MKLTTEDRKALQGAINVLSGVLQQASPEVPVTLYEWPEDDTHLRGKLAEVWDEGYNAGDNDNAGVWNFDRGATPNPYQEGTES